MIPPPVAQPLQAALDRLARQTVLLVAVDFDGTIAPLVADPQRAEADREALVALRALAALPHTHAAIVSGRALQDLAGRVDGATHVHLIGSHGSEYELGLFERLTPAQQALHARLLTWSRELADRNPGVILEEKPASLAIHYRQISSPAAVAALVAEIESGPAAWPGVIVKSGKCVQELGVVVTDKGAALETLRRRCGAHAVLFFGDDATDEDAFATLNSEDVGVKVGPGASRAPFRLDTPAAVARRLAELVESRELWLRGADDPPIERHTLLSDQRTVALLDPRGRVTWMCVPRLDSGALFAELLGGPQAGYFEIAPLEFADPPQQAYLDDTLILETNWGAVRVIDYLDCGGGRPFQRAGRTDLIRAVSGRGRVRIGFAPRLDFGRLETRLSPCGDGLLVEGSVESLVLYAPGVSWTITADGRHQTATAVVDLSDEPLVLELRIGTANIEPGALPEPTRRERTQRFWSGWAATLRLPGAARSAVLRSALTLKALCYGPTGAFAAAATTSLPEAPGGTRNWDYRFCWPRDAAMSASALLRLGATGPGIKFLDWVLGLLDGVDAGTLIRPIYTVSGGHLGSEGEIAQLRGYRGSRPVRVGNAAAQQVQLDVLGPIAELAAQLAEAEAALSSEHWRLIETLVHTVAQRWREPDHGIWEVRSAQRHHVHSKVMCWLTVDRALAVASYLGYRRPAWKDLAADIAADVLSRGWSDRTHAFGAAYDNDAADAAALAVGLSGLLPPDDPRFVATVAYVERELRVGPTVYRYRYEDGLPGVEGGFSLCTAWLIEAYARIGRQADAAALLCDFLAQLGPTGLMAEEYDPHARTALGNFPQAYSHLGIIQAVLAVHGAPA